MDLTLHPLLPGPAAAGLPLVLSAPISFWGGVDPATGDIIDARHPERGQNITGRILVMPGTIGSSSASAVLLELVHAAKAPSLILIHEPDAILLLGLVIAREMGWPTPAAWQLDKAGQQQLKDQHITVDASGRIKIREEGL